MMLLRKNCGKKSKSFIARSVFFSVIQTSLYHLSFWDYCSQCFFQSVIKGQKRALRFMTNAFPWDHARPLFIRYSNPPCLFDLESVTFIYKHISSFPDHQTSYLTRQISIIPLPIPCSALVKNSIIYTNIKLYITL